MHRPPPRLRDSWPQPEHPRVVPAASGEHLLGELYAMVCSSEGYRDPGLSRRSRARIISGTLEPRKVLVSRRAGSHAVPITPTTPTIDVSRPRTGASVLAFARTGVMARSAFRSDVSREALPRFLAPTGSIALSLPRHHTSPRPSSPTIGISPQPPGHRLASLARIRSRVRVSRESRARLVSATPKYRGTPLVAVVTSHPDSTEPSVEESHDDIAAGLRAHLFSV